VIAPPTSQITRKTIGTCKIVRSDRIAPLRSANPLINIIANTLRTSMTCPKLISDETNLVIASFSAKHAVAITMNTLPRRLGERFTGFFGCQASAPHQDEMPVREIETEQRRAPD
jgi:hypothetical protein